MASALRVAARLAPDIALAALIVVGVFRPQLPDVLKANWVALVVLLGTTAALLRLIKARRLRREGQKDPFPLVLGSVFALTLVALYIQPQRVASDGVHYFATLRSIVVDGDLDFENEYRILGAQEGYFLPTDTGRLPNNFSVGPALLWSPTYLVVHGLGHAGLFRPTGIGYPYFTAISTVTAFGGFLGVLWLYGLVRLYFEPSVAFTASLLIWMGTFHFWYMVFEPSMSHALGMASVTGFLLLCHRTPKHRWDYALLGLVAGLVALLRWQNIVFVPVGLVLFWKKTGWPKWQELALFTGTAVAAFLPQMVFWKLIYGHFLLVPQGGGYMGWASPELEAVLFSSRHGLLSWSPVLWLGVAGLVGLTRRTPVFAGSLLAAFALTLYVNAAVHDWWAGASFGARRFDGALAGFGLGLAMSIEWLIPWVRKHALLVVSLALAPFAVWNLSLMRVYSLGAIPMDGPVSFRSAAGDATELIYRVTGYPFSWPPALFERFRSGAPMAVYDLAGAQYLSNNVEIRMGDTDALHLGRGWSLPQRRRGRTERAVAPHGASIYVALREPAPYRLKLEGRSDGPLSLSFGAHALGSVDLGARGGMAEVSVPEDAVVTGLNELTLVPEKGTSAWVSSLSLVRPGEY
jgi:hypothetical protein